MENNKLDILGRIKVCLQTSGKTQKDLCEYAQIPVSTLNNWLKKARSIPAEYIIPISEFLEVSVNYLILGIEEKPAKVDFSEDEAELLESYRTLDRLERKVIDGKIAELILEKKTEESGELFPIPSRVHTSPNSRVGSTVK